VTTKISCYNTLIISTTPYTATSQKTAIFIIFKVVPMLNYAPYHDGKCRSGGTVTPVLIFALDGGEWSDASPVPSYP